MKLLSLLTLVLLTSCKLYDALEYKKEECSKIKTIGSCSRGAWCSVALENGNIQLVRYPIVGGLACKMATTTDEYWELQTTE